MTDKVSSTHESSTPEQQKTKYFSALAISQIDALRTHRDRGLWEHVSKEDGSTERDWGNVSKHCLVEAARVSIFADILDFDENLARDLETAAILHDFYKKDEVKKLMSNETSWEAYSEAQTEAKALLVNYGFSPRQIEIATSPGHETVMHAQELLQKPDLTQDEIAWLVLHYVDDYTINDRPVAPVSLSNGRLINDLDRRMEANRMNAEPGKKYHSVQLSGVEHFGELTYDAQSRIGNLVEDRLAQLVSEKLSRDIQPKILPEFIDAKLSEIISSSGHSDEA